MLSVVSSVAFDGLESNGSRPSEAAELTYLCNVLVRFYQGLYGMTPSGHQDSDGTLLVILKLCSSPTFKQFHLLVYNQLVDHRQVFQTFRAAFDGVGYSHPSSWT